MLRFIAFLFGKHWDSCESCLVLKEQIKRLEAQNHQLLDRLLKLSEPEIIPQNPIPVPQKPRIANWNAAKKEMEAQDRKTLETLKKIEETEKSLGMMEVTDATKSTGTDA